MGQLHRATLPGGPEHVRQQRLHEAWRHIDQQLGDLAEGDRLKVLADRLKSPSIAKSRAGLQDMPEVADEAQQASLPHPVLIAVASGLLLQPGAPLAGFAREAQEALHLGARDLPVGADRTPLDRAITP